LSVRLSLSHSSDWSSLRFICGQSADPSVHTSEDQSGLRRYAARFTAGRFSFTSLGMASMIKSDKQLKDDISSAETRADIAAWLIEQELIDFRRPRRHLMTAANRALLISRFLKVRRSSSHSLLYYCRACGLMALRRRHPCPTRRSEPRPLDSSSAPAFPHHGGVVRGGPA
jgi:hypothetical protein